MKAFGFRDMLKIPDFEGLSEVDLLSPKWDKMVMLYLQEFGIDTEYGVEITVANYRDLSNKTGIGYRYVGDIRCGRDFIQSPWCDITDRVAVAGYQDPALAKELMEMLSQPVIRFDPEEGEDNDSKEYALAPDQYEEDYIKDMEYIKLLENMLYVVRGSQRTESGAIKLLGEYE